MSRFGCDVSMLASAGDRPMKVHLGDCADAGDDSLYHRAAALNFNLGKAASVLVAG